MKPHSKYIMFTVSLFILAGCATGNMRVSSTPDKAEVYIASEGEQLQKVGETPLDMDSRILENKRGKFITLQLRKEGYQPETVLIPTSLVKTSVDVSTRMDEHKLPLQCQGQTDSVEKIARGIANIQTHINTNNLGEAQLKLNNLLSEYPNISVLHDLLGNVHYMNKNLNEALKSYERSLKLDPNNSDTQRIAQKIRGIVDVRMPAASGGF